MPGNDEAPAAPRNDLPGPGWVPADFGSAPVEKAAERFNPFATEDEVEAMVESARLTRRALVPPRADDDELPDDQLVSVPRRRELPRRREAA